MITLFVGDTDNKMKVAALEADPNAQFLHNDNLQFYLNTESGNFYTGLAFLKDLKNFLAVCNHANKIVYCPPLIWSDENKGSSDQKKYVEIILSYISQKTTVDGLLLKDNPYSFLQQDYRIAQRNTNDPQIWIAGCSITQGDGVEQEESWKVYVSKYFNMPYTDLSLRGSSIIWQSDQICQADIRAGDRVFWGLTSHFRLPVIYEKDNSLFHLHAGSYQKSHLNEKVQNFPIDLLLNKTIVYHNVMAVRRAVNFCKKIGAEITILGLMYDWDLIYKFLDVTVFRQAMSWPHRDLDIGTDNIHPGPRQHQQFAQQFIEFYNELYK